MVFDVRTLVQPFTHYCNRSLMSLQFSKRFYTIDDHNNLTLKSETFWSTPDISLLPKVHCIYCVLSLETSSQPDNQELIQETTLLMNTKLLSELQSIACITSLLKYVEVPRATPISANIAIYYWLLVVFLRFQMFYYNIFSNPWTLVFFDQFRKMNDLKSPILHQF